MNIHGNVDPIHALLTQQLHSSDPTRVARMHTIIKALTTSLLATKNLTQGRVYVHRGVNANKEAFFRAVQESVLPGVSWWLEDINSAWTLNNHLRNIMSQMVEGQRRHGWSRYPVLIVLNRVPPAWMPAISDTLGALIEASPMMQIHVLQDVPLPCNVEIVEGLSVENFVWRTQEMLAMRPEELPSRIFAWLCLRSEQTAPSEAPATAPAARPQPSAATSAATLQPGQKTVPSAPETSVEQKTVGEQVAEEMVRLHEASSEGRQAASDYADFAVSNAGLVARSLLSLSAETLALKRTAADSSRTLNAPAGQVLRQMAERAAKTAIYPGAGTGDFAARVYTALALAGEAGEVAGKASKTVRDGATPDLVARLHMELGDTFWHWLMACQEWGADPDAVVAQMFSRLQDRQERGVLAGSGDAR